jgi:hypothetical protein
MVNIECEEKVMAEFYVKNKLGKYLPIELKSIVTKEFNGKLVIVRVGTDEHSASASDLDETEQSFSQADVLNELDNVSIIITPYQIDISTAPKAEIDEKQIYVQITSGNDVIMLEEQVRKIYNKLRKKHETVVVSTPLKVGDYRKVQDILKRCQIRKERRGSKAKL